MPYMVERIVHCHVVLPVLLVADSAYDNAVGGRCIGGGLLRFIELPGGACLYQNLKSKRVLFVNFLKITLVLFCYFNCGGGGLW